LAIGLTSEYSQLKRLYTITVDDILTFAAPLVNINLIKIIKKLYIFLSSIITGRKLPVDQVPERSYIYRPGISIVYVVGVFPHITG
jgi:hypothetical protein